MNPDLPTHWRGRRPAIAQTELPPISAVSTGRFGRRRETRLALAQLRYATRCYDLHRPVHTSVAPTRGFAGQSLASRITPYYGKFRPGTQACSRTLPRVGATWIGRALRPTRPGQNPGSDQAFWLPLSCRPLLKWGGPCARNAVHRRGSELTQARSRAVILRDSRLIVNVSWAVCRLSLSPPRIPSFARSYR